MATIPTSSDQKKFLTLPGFNPHYTPREILELGVFGGTYFSKYRSQQGLPKELFEGLPIEKYDAASFDVNNNYFQVNADQRRRDFNMPNEFRMIDPFGWFQWYCNFFYGRKTGADVHRSAQWKDELQTIMFYINKACELQEKPLTDLTVEPVWRQQALNFGWDSTKPFNL